MVKHRREIQGYKEGPGQRHFLLPSKCRVILLLWGLDHPWSNHGMTICDQSGMSGMTHEPPTGSQQAEDQEPRAKVRPKALTGWKTPRAPPTEQNLGTVLWVQRLSIQHLQQWVTGR